LTNFVGNLTRRKQASWPRVFGAASEFFTIDCGDKGFSQALEKENCAIAGIIKLKSKKEAMIKNS